MSSELGVLQWLNSGADLHYFMSSEPEVLQCLHSGADLHYFISSEPGVLQCLHPGADSQYSCSPNRCGLLILESKLCIHFMSLQEPGSGYGKHTRFFQALISRTFNCSAGSEIMTSLAKPFETDGNQFSISSSSFSTQENTAGKMSLIPELIRKLRLHQHGLNHHYQIHISWTSVQLVCI